MRALLSLLILLISVFAVAVGTPPKMMEIDHGVFRGVQPKPEDFAAMKAAGITTILNLRWDKSVEQSRAEAEAAGFKFVNVPINAVNGPTDEDMKLVFDTIHENQAHGIYFHCTLGRDRTGLVAALYRVIIQGRTPADAYAEWTGFGFSNSFLRKLDKYFWKAVGSLNGAPAAASVPFVAPRAALLRCPSIFGH